MSPLCASAIWYGSRFLACCTSGALSFRPISLFTAQTVFIGFVIIWRFAMCPTRRSPLSVKPTMDGMVRLPSFVGMTWGLPPSMNAMQQFVVPRSIPMIWPTGPSQRRVRSGRRRRGPVRTPRGRRDGHLHHRRPEDPPRVDVPFADLLDDRVGGEPRPGLRGDRLVEGGIERLPEGLDRLHPHPPEALADLPPDEGDPLPEARRLRGLGQGAVEVVERREDLFQDPSGGPDTILLPV